MSKKIFSALLTIVAVFFVFGFTHKAEAAITRVQTVAAGANATTVSATWPGATTAGNLLVAIVAVRGGSGVTITPPTVSPAWTLANRSNNGTTVSTAIYYIANASAQSGSSSWGLSPSSRATLTLVEYSGAATSSVLDKTATSTGTSSTGSSGITATTIQANEVAVAGISGNDSRRNYSAQTNGFTEVSTVNSAGNANGTSTVFEEKILAATGTQSVSATISASAVWAGTIATFKAAPVAPGIPDMTTATDTGSSNTDNITSNTTPSFSISCITGFTVTLFDNVTSVGTGTCAASTVTIASSVLSSGVHSINAKQGGSVASANLSITIDTTNPTSSISSPTNNSYSTSTTVALSGTSSDTNLSSTTISVDGGGFVATGGTAASWTYSATSLSQGAHSFQTKATDLAGNTGLSSVVNVTVDSVSPTVTNVTSSTADGTYKDGVSPAIISIQVTFSELVNRVSGLPPTQLTLSTGSPATTAVNYLSGSGTNTFNFNYTVEPGNYSADLDYASTTALSANGDTLTDTAGNSVILTLPSPGAAGSLGANKNIVIDAVGPTTPGTPTTTTPTNDTTPTWSWTASTDTGTGISHYDVAWSQDPNFFSGVSNTTSVTNSFTHSTPLADGTWYLKVQAFDGIGNVSLFSGTGSIVIDTIAPDTTILTNPTDPAHSSSASFTFSSNEVDSTFQCDLDGAGYSSCTSPKSYTSLLDGSHTFSVKATDTVGNIDLTPATFTWNIINTFTLTYTAGANGAISGTSPQIVNYGANGAEVIAVADSGYHFTSWSDGVLTDARTDSNVTANISVTASFEVNPDITPPTIPGLPSASTPETDNTPTWSWAASTDSESGLATPAYTVEWSQGVSFEIIFGTSSAISTTFTHSDTLADGTWYFRVKATDIANNSSNYSDIGSIVINTVPPAIKFVIVNPTDNVVGNDIAITVQAEDLNNNIVSTYQNNITLVADGSATGAGLVDIINGVGTINISDTTAETVNLSLSDTESTGLDFSSTQDVVFSAGTLSHFVIDNISSPQIAGLNIGLIVTAKDSFGNTVVSFGGTVDFSTTAGNVTPAISDSFTSGILNQNISVTLSGTGKTITVTRTSSSETGTSNSFTVNPGATAKFILNNPGNMTAGTTIGYTVTRKDQNNNLVTGGSDTVYLYSSSGSTSKFYDAAADGNQIFSIVIPDTQSSGNFWYYDDNIGDWNVTVSDNALNSDGNTGIDDSTDSINVSEAPIIPTKFIIEAVSTPTVGDTVLVSVKAVDGNNNLATSYNRTDSSLVLNSTGSSTASTGISFNINNGVGTINISDTTAEMITLSLTDNNPDVPPFTLTTRDITFLSGVFDHFVMDNISSPQTAGVAIGITLTAKDSYENIVTSFNNTVDFSTTAGSITPTISNNFISGVLTQNISVTLSGTGKTVTATKTGDAQFVTSNVFDVNSALVDSFLVEASGGGSLTTQTVGVPFDIKITAKDSFGNIATGFTGTVNVSSTGILSSGGGTTTSFIDGILSAHSITISNSGLFTITATRTGGAETGISNTFTVSLAPIVATKFIILNPLDVQVGQLTTVTVKAVDNSGNVDSTYQDDIILVVSGSATGAGLVDIINGVGTMTITDDVIENVTLSLSDIVPPTTLIFTSTQNVVFSAIPPSFSGSGTGVSSASTISFSGQGFPSGNLTAFAISNGAIPVKQDLIKSLDGRFNLNFSSELSGTNQYGVFITDKEGRISQAKIYTIKNGVPTLDVKGLVMSPTVGLLRNYLSKGDFLSVDGYASPGSVISFEIDGSVINEKVTASADGSYKLLWNTSLLSFGKHSLRVNQTTKEGFSSEFSPTKDFNLTRYNITPTDFNSDGKVNVNDMSIFLSLWYNKTNPDRNNIDLNHDGKVNIQDLSIFSRTLKQ